MLPEEPLKSFILTSITPRSGLLAKIQDCHRKVEETATFLEK